MSSSVAEEETKETEDVAIPKKKRAPRKKKAKKKREPSRWILHIKKTQEKEKCSYKEAMKLASKTYVKKKKSTKTASSAKESAAAGDTADGGSQ